MRKHSAPKKEMLERMATLGKIGMEMYCYESAQYCLASDNDTTHYGLNKGAYAYATSPIRRYCDMINQRILKDIILGTSVAIEPTQDCVNELNRRQKQAKAFSRDMFFMRIVNHTDPVNGYVIERCSIKTKLWIPTWRRVITLREVLPETTNLYSIKWYSNIQIPRWKDRIVFRADPIYTN